MFLESLAMVRRDFREHPDTLPPGAGKTGEDFLSAYQSFSRFTTDLHGFWSILKFAQGQDDSIDTFFETITNALQTRNQPTSVSAAPAVLPH